MILVCKELNIFVYTVPSARVVMDGQNINMFIIVTFKVHLSEAAFVSGVYARAHVYLVTAWSLLGMAW